MHSYFCAFVSSKTAETKQSRSIKWPTEINVRTRDSAYKLVLVRDLVRCTPILISSRNGQYVRAVAATGHVILIEVLQLD